MNTIMKIWEYFGYAVYWLSWLGSVLIMGAPIKGGIITGVYAVAIWFIIYGIIAFIAIRNETPLFKSDNNLTKE